MGGWVDVGNKAQSVLNQEHKVTVLSSVVFNRSEELVGPEPEFSQRPSDETLTFPVLSSCLKHKVLLLLTVSEYGRCWAL